MRYQDEKLRDMLAAEYVLGTLAGRARARFQRLMHYDPRLRSLVAQWEARLNPMAGALPDTAPPERVWQAIQARIARNRATPSQRLWSSLALWRGLAAAAGALALVIAVYLGKAPQAEPPVSTLAVLADAKQQPVVLVSWPPQTGEGRFVKVKLLEQAELPPGKSWQLWMLPGGEQKPVSMGLVNSQRAQTLRLSAPAAGALKQAWGLAISLEPPGGSPTGQPTGPVILQGRCVKLI